MLFFALSTALFLWSRTVGVLAFIWASLIVCLPRIYMGLHFPSDIIVGAVIGVATMLAAQRMPLPSGISEAIERYESKYSAAFYTFAFFLTYQIAMLLRRPSIRLARADDRRIGQLRHCPPRGGGPIFAAVACSWMKTDRSGSSHTSR